MKTWLTIALPLLFTACQPLDLASEATYDLGPDPLVIVAEADEPTQSLSLASLVIEDAPDGDYVAFVSATPPSNLSSLATIDWEKDCKKGSGTTCELPGVGALRGRDTLAARGRVKISVFGGMDTYVTFARLGSGGATPLRAVVKIWSSGGDGGCSHDPFAPTQSRVNP